MNYTTPEGRCHAVSRALAGSATVLGGLVLAGWAFDVPMLKAVIPGLATMKPNTAFCFVLGGVALGVRSGPQAWRRVGQLCGALVLVIGLATLAEYVLHLDLGLDALLFRDPHPTPGAPYPERMSEMTALSFASAGGALLFLDSRRAPVAAEILALVGVLVALIALVGYAYGARALYAVAPFSSVALHTALGLAALSLAILCARPDRGMVAVLIGDAAGGAMARRLLPLAVALPLALGWLELEGERIGLYGTSFGTGAYAVSNIVIFSAATLWCAISLSRSDAERLRAERELKRSNEELERFAYVASHDLQEPLRMVGNYVQLLGKRYKGKLDADADDFIGFALDGALRMQRLIEDLLAYARVSSRGAEPAPTDANAALAHALASLKLATDEANAVVTHDPLPVVPADPSQLEHVFLNLIGNALKFRSSERPVIHVTAAPRDSEWLFSVSDNGIGIEAQHFDRIFVIFQRLHGREAYPGTGIGLAIAKRIIERHRGQIWVEARPGQGSTFFFTLPATGRSS